MNGRYDGLYQLGEGIEVASDRVNLPTGGALLEADAWPDTDPSFVTPKGLQVFVKSSEDTEFAAQVQQQVSHIEDVLYSPDYTAAGAGYRSCLDVDTFVNGYLLAELSKNIDGSFKNSLWMVLGADGRLAIGPAWDYDQSMGNRLNCEVDQPTGWFVATNWFYIDRELSATCTSTSQISVVEGNWYQRLLSDPAFAARVRTRWAEVRSSLAELPALVRARAQVVEPSAELNFTPRDQGGAGMPIGPTIVDTTENHVFHGTWDAEADALASWLQDRIAWLDDQFTQ